MKKKGIEIDATSAELKICPQEECPFLNPHTATEGNILAWIYIEGKWKKLSLWGKNLTESRF